MKLLPLTCGEYVHAHVLVHEVQSNSVAAFGPKHVTKFGKYVQISK